MPEPNPHYRVGQRIRVLGGVAVPNAWEGRLADIIDTSRDHIWVRLYSGNSAKPVLEDRVGFSTETAKERARWEFVRGKPYIAGIDPPRAMGARKKQPKPKSPMVLTSPVVSKPFRTTTRATTPKKETRTTMTAPASKSKSEAAASIAALLAGAGGMDEDAARALAKAEVAAAMKPHVARIKALEGTLDPLLSALNGEARTVARLTVAAGAMSGSPFLDALTKYYTPGQEAAANVLLASPPSFGKSYAARALGQTYDLYLEHGCSDDMDEIATVLGSPVPDGKGGFIVVDGVVTEAVRTASTGKTVLLLLDEVLRLSPRAQEWLLTFLTGVKTPEGRRYRLRTRRAMPDGTLEIIECPAANLHIVGATNLGVANPIEAFWSRWETVRIEFSLAMAESVGKAILSSYGIADAGDKLAKTWAVVVKESRQSTAESRLRFPVDFRVLERAAQMAPNPTARAVAAWAADRIGDNTANWNPDTGDVNADSLAVIVPWVTKLRSL